VDVLDGHFLLAAASVSFERLNLSDERPGELVKGALGGILLCDKLDMRQASGERHRRVVDGGHLSRQHSLNLIAGLDPPDDCEHEIRSAFVRDRTLRSDIDELLEEPFHTELKGTAYAVVDGVDGRTHHVKLPDLDAAGDSAQGSIVELRKFDDAQGRRRVALAVRSDLSIERQITATGATWLDRQAIAREPVAPGQGGFGAEVREALERRAEQLIDQGLAERQARGLVFARNLIGTLRKREVEVLGKQLAAETGRPFNAAAAGEYVAGTYRQRFALGSGRFAVIDDGLGFQLVPWSPSLEKQLGRHVSGVARDDGGIQWDFGRKRGLGL
jgi:hypothetical protein